ncbi:hypothetical protein GCM10025865_26810 [Paraoerskovia sediminicola]|uniref:YdhG-like domain-containing protein n=1 Tax=Paraoerskovia sediminicola TaxID=1138587 RepID=A0ABN6XI63_9CELL|nr:DUF1801 domain-containing protein [Paraoerskovia sediminicola]BDZ43382.1 hypothetical protein GCM10025865_26810 [Paraoerskovia sediminicola]
MAYEQKTRPTDADVDAFVDAVESPTRRRDARTLLDLFGRVTGLEPVMWGPSIIGYGTHHYRYATGHEGDMCAAGFSPRKAATVVYLYGSDADPELLDRLGPHRRGVGCLYVTNLAKVDMDVLEQLVRDSYEALAASPTEQGGTSGTTGGAA